MSCASIELEGTQQVSLHIGDVPQKLLACATKGSLPDLRALATSMTSQAFPSRLLPKAVDLFTATLRQHRKRPFEDDIVPACLMGLASLDVAFYKARKALSQKVVACWPMVWEWIEQAGHDILIGDSFDWHHLETIEHGLKAFSAQRQVMEEEVILQLATRIWLYRNDNSSFSRHLGRPAFAVISLDAIRSSAQSKAPIRILDRVYGKAISLGWSAESIVDMTISRLQNIPKLSAEDEHTLYKTFDGISHSLKAIIIVPSGSQDNAHLNFLRAGGIRRMLNLLENIVSFLGSTPPDPLALKAASALSIGLWVIAYLVRCASGISLIRSALKHGLLGVLQSAMPRLSILKRALHSGHEAIHFLLSKVLPSTFVFRSVVITAHQYLRKWFDACGGICCGCGLPKSLADCEMSDIWEAFFYMLRHQVSANRFFRKCLKEQAVCCAHPICGTSGIRSAFRKCAGCKTALFCSTDCQRPAWVDHGHRIECARTSQWIASSELSSSDARYLSLVAHEAVRRALHRVVFHSNCREDQQIQKKLPPSRRGFTIDYTKPGIDVHQFSFESRPGFDSSLTLPTIKTMGKIESFENEDEDEHSPDLKGDVKPDGTLRTTLEILYAFGSETRRLYVSAEFSGLAYHGDECTCCRFHGDDSSASREHCNGHKAIA
ncbi:hypothetical protein SCHPADRAFT_904661 [Schizopora paradoxa]|uniref:MYND-type domain-containing protein n=1 Tax=Schizopora paradoxa TaxID=27342 RepID=A0A0H2RLX2_9AGAM|nr:hypothetical protein SCHPADRAFT_904661 [Schizopora paradoxa]